MPRDEIPREVLAHEVAGLRAELKQADAALEENIQTFIEMQEKLGTLREGLRMVTRSSEATETLREHAQRYLDRAK